MDEFGEEKSQAEVVRFYKRPVVDPEATEKAGRPVHMEAVYINIVLPGDRNTEADRPIYESDKKRYPRHWAAFLADTSQESVSGTMLSAWGHLSPAQVEDYRYLKVLTVEQLASVPDSSIHKFGLGAVAHRQAALDYMEAAKSRAPILRLERQLAEERSARLAQDVLIRQLVAAQGGTLAVPAGALATDAGSTEGVSPEVLAAEAPTPPPRRRGRPAKAIHKEST